MNAVKRYPTVYVIVLNWNGWEDTLDCLTSLQDLDYPNYEVVVVDNASSDGSEGRIRSVYPTITLLQSGENLGFAGGNNVGINYAIEKGTEYIWLLNNDTVVHPEALRWLVEETARYPSVGMVGSKIYFYEPPDVIWFAGGTVNKLTGRTVHLLSLKKDDMVDERPQDVDYVTACSMLVSRGVIESIGLLDTRFFLYYEETDWANRAKLSGWRVRYQPRSKVWHKVSRSSRLNSPTMVFHFARSSIIFAKKHISPIPVLPLVMTVRHQVLPFLLRGQYYTALAGIRGMISGMTNAL